jgi:uncharacterized protein
METFETIEVVLKVSERCNISCSYCYMFNQANDEYATRPAYMAQETVKALGSFLSQAAAVHRTERVHVIFHGGEPMMMKPSRFDEVCSELEEALGTQCHLRLSMQTNAMLVDARWLDVLIKHDVGVGVSIDGPAEYHDADRLHHKGGGTYREVVRGLRALQETTASDLLKPVGAIAVIRPKFSGEVVFDHFVRVLGIRNMSFLLPIDTHDTFNKKTVSGYTDYLLGVLRAWSRANDKELRVRFIDEMLAFLSGGEDGVSQMRSNAASFALFVVGSGGELEPDDALKPTVTDGRPRPTIFSHTLAEFLSTPEMLEVHSAIGSIPKSCVDCCWQNGCRGSGGRLVNRYSRAKGFDNPSFLCQSLKAAYSSVAASLLAAGVSRATMLNAMCYPALPVMTGEALPSKRERAQSIMSLRRM